MNEKPMDRRVRKTRALYRKCLVELMKKKKIQDISVREISELADLNRGTFYLHYKDVFDLLEQIEEELLRNLRNALSLYSPSELKDKPSLVFLEIYQLLQENKDILEILLGDNGDLNFLARLKQIVHDHCFHSWMAAFHHENPKILDPYYYFIVSGCIGVAQYWLQSGMKESPAELAELSEKMVLDGIRAIQ